MTAGLIRKIHAYAQGGSTLSGGGDAGEWKKRNNEIIEILPGGDRRVRFVPATAKDTPGLIDDLCRSYREPETADTSALISSHSTTATSRLSRTIESSGSVRHLSRHSKRNRTT